MEERIMKTRILLADDDAILLREMSDYFTSSPDYEVVGRASTGKDAIALFNSLHPDAMILDMLMPYGDGLTVLNSIDKIPAKIIAISGVSEERYAQSALSGGADYFLLKPFLMTELDQKVKNTRLRTPVKSYNAIKRTGLEQRITEIFMTVGIPAHIKGYQFLREAIKMAIDSPEIINSITKRLYPDVAQRFETSPSKVERAIRHAIEVAWNKGKIENINSLFGVKVYSSNEKPTNGEFIALVADKMMLENI